MIYIPKYFIYKIGASHVLSQNDRVVEYESQKLRKHEENHSTHDLELDAIVHALKHWRHFLLGVKFEFKQIMKV